jgi:hypothetical protein
LPRLARDVLLAEVRILFGLLGGEAKEHPGIARSYLHFLGQFLERYDG